MEGRKEKKVRWSIEDRRRLTCNVSASGRWRISSPTRGRPGRAPSAAPCWPPRPAWSCWSRPCPRAGSGSCPRVGWWWRPCGGGEDYCEGWRRMIRMEEKMRKIKYEKAWRKRGLRRKKRIEERAWGWEGLRRRKIIKRRGERERLKRRRSNEKRREGMIEKEEKDWRWEELRKRKNDEEQDW